MLHARDLSVDSMIEQEQHIRVRRCRHGLFNIFDELRSLNIFCIPRSHGINLPCFIEVTPEKAAGSLPL